MGRQSDPRKAAAWARRLARFSDSGLWVAWLSDRDGVMNAPLRYWLRKLSEAPGSEGGCSSAALTVADLNLVTVVSRLAVKIRRRGRRDDEDLGGFRGSRESRDACD